MRSAHIQIVASLSLLFAICHAAPWTAEQYPNPSINVTQCGRNGVRSWVCDPDGVVSYAEANIVEGLVKEIEAGQHPYVRHTCGTAGLEGYQVCGGVGYPAGAAAGG
jgi:Modulator of levamisole receptor-1